MQSPNDRNNPRTPTGGYNFNLSPDGSSHKQLKATFITPIYLRDFWDQLRQNCVKLENVVIDRLKCFATVKVKNLAYEKVVLIRYTLNDWRTYQDLPAYHLKDSNRGYADTFAFEFNVPDEEEIRQVQFAIAFRCAGQEFWDNNHNRNYCLQCIPIQDGHLFNNLVHNA
ncbi:Glycogen-binding subunit 76A [Trichoplax sp. H2]|uniref:CBM21 domain-containing protein n=1 Tax=Trichoplax adhaerens TaxID=10228 RepID=B3S2Z1_TRIAD|nr:hypothetical protein TRIADDRAFT_58536 [Trichoplax adhaerens]EDV22874.1 hypothetical protein TRIADDRAFT_58536 [Trichoplax adhaerens]RDD37508.1 Glycogen-binding subunit 76A [Trichoplax sp. H2]|eukprot:XP_002114740.1 hypothetical protein TRIADDRAFT_58536 [Trichoplax adhaerens]